MIPLYRYERKRAFAGLRGWLFGAALLMAAGIAAAYACFYGGSAEIQYVLSGAEYALIPAVPYLCADSMAADRKNGNEGFLATLPVSTARVVWGKYLGLMSVVAVPVGLLCLLPPVFSLYGEVDLAASYGAILFFFLLCAGLVAVCQLISALTDRPIRAGLIGLAVLAGGFLLPPLSLLLPEAGWLSLGIFILLAGGIGVLGWRCTGSRVLGAVTAGLLAAGELVLYLLFPSLYRGLFPSLCVSLSPFLCFEQAISYGLLELDSLLLLCALPVLCVSLTVAVLRRRRLA